MYNLGYIVIGIHVWLLCLHGIYLWSKFREKTLANPKVPLSDILYTACPLIWDPLPRKQSVWGILVEAIAHPCITCIFLASSKCICESFHPLFNLDAITDVRHNCSSGLGNHSHERRLR